jgi:sugar O-acyltransferase (sialic acid O-acetyltransferase NeuD family)
MKDKLPLVLLGCGGHARSCIDLVEKEGRFKIVGIIGQRHEVGSQVFQYPVIASDEDLSVAKKISDHALIAVGQIKSPDTRIRLFHQLLSSGWNLPTLISPLAYVSGRAEIGSGTVVMHGAIVNAGVKLGQNCIVNSRALIEHDCLIGDHCHIATGAILNGGVNLGGESFVGSGALLREGILVPSRSIIPIGQSIGRNICTKT